MSGRKFSDRPPQRPDRPNEVTASGMQVGLLTAGMVFLKRKYDYEATTRRRYTPCEKTHEKPNCR
jgi:hypothetical protein